jgi:hypothetical protein
MIHVLSLAALGLAVCYGAWLSALWYFQERVVFQPPAGGAPSAMRQGSRASRRGAI